LSTRLAGGPAATAWRGEVPAALVKPLRDWIGVTLRPNTSVMLGGAHGLAERVLLRLDLALPLGERMRSDESARGYLAYEIPAELLPDVVDAVLYLLPLPVRIVVKPPPSGKSVPLRSFLDAIPAAETWSDGRRGVLSGLLDDSLSVLRVRADGRGLERRSDVSSEAAFAEAVRSAETVVEAGSAARQLRTAWQCVYALHPDPVKAYAEAVKAVESAAHAVVEPRQKRATLGTMLGHLKANRDRFSLAIAGPDGRGDIGPLIECVKLLWDGHTSRHGSSSPTRDETLEEAAMAVDLAVVLVRWFTSGAVRRSAGTAGG
jgi:hypothetical protein